ncbi:MAG TPA: membrane protein insertase YidC [Candidatus Avilachnospira avistercoris]|nr:membrane protein insertase YidC [Candidatus Avilachnospira avistercoris]
MDGIFRVMSSFGIVNIGVCIIIFTIVTRILMMPLSYKQAKSQKIMAMIQPQVALIQQKYKGKENDQNAMMMQNAEIKAVYERYGTSMTGGCLQLVIQFPIILALYRVIQFVPTYVSGVRIYFDTIIEKIGGAAAVSAVNDFAHSSETLTRILSTARITDQTITSTDQIMDFLYYLNPSQWQSFIEYIRTNGLAAENVISQAITPNMNAIIDMNNFLGINLASSPSSYGLASIQAWIIPLLAGLSQFLATKMMSKTTQSATSADASAAQMMNTMNYTMPLISIFFCFSISSGVGIYWIASSVIMGVTQYLLNRHMQKVNADDIIKKNLEKANKKRAKKGLPPINEKTQEDNIRKMQLKLEKEEAKRQAQLEATKSHMEDSNSYYKTGSIAERARMVQQYNEKHDKNRKK